MSCIDWGNFPNQSEMQVACLDHAAVPRTVLDSNSPFYVRVQWEVPEPISCVIGGSFRLRIFADSVGPGPDRQIGPTMNVPAIPNRTVYTQNVLVDGGALSGQGEAAAPQSCSSGVYKIVAVLQHVNGSANEVSGFAESPLIQLRKLEQLNS